MEKKFLPIKWTDEGWIVCEENHLSLIDLMNVRATTEEERNTEEKKFGIITLEKRINPLDT